MYIYFIVYFLVIQSDFLRKINYKKVLNFRRDLYVPHEPL